MVASLGFADARSLAKLGAVVTNGGVVDGMRILRQSTVRQMLSDVSFKTDVIFGDAIMGWTKGGLYRWDPGAQVYGIPDGCVGWAGLGGSMLILDTQRQLSVSFCTPSMRHLFNATERRWRPFMTAIYETLDVHLPAARAAGESAKSKWRSASVAARFLVKEQRAASLASKPNDMKRSRTLGFTPT
mmetsp:Transcript_5712/g.16660  ORF Transcript_5712/g.16660 Transcript_5712/m.16660 type:complete len:186 (-) Transcript_5712:303-860(-)